MATEDRRVRRTRKLLREALVALALERGYGGITVEDITERADVGRATFYTHYTDKDALFEQIVTDLIEELHERLRPLVRATPAGFTGKPVLEMFRHAAEDREVYRVILRGEGDGRALRRFVNERSTAAAAVFRARADFHDVTPRIDVDILARAWVGEQIAVLQWWIESDPPPHSPEVVTEMLLDLSLRGRYWANGFDGEPTSADITSASMH